MKGYKYELVVTKFNVDIMRFNDLSRLKFIGIVKVQSKGVIDV